MILAVSLGVSDQQTFCLTTGVCTSSTLVWKRPDQNLALEGDGGDTPYGSSQQLQQQGAFLALAITRYLVSRMSASTARARC